MPAKKAKKQSKKAPKAKQTTKPNIAKKANKPSRLAHLNKRVKSEASFKKSYQPKFEKPPKNYFKSTKNWLFRLDTKKVFIVVFSFVAIIFGAFMVNVYLDHKANQDFYDQVQKEQNITLAEINAKKVLIGNKDQLISEIVNYQSAPADLQQYVLLDYYGFKADCIVNGKFISPVTYEITNVVYDNFAKISKICHGNDQQIVAKVGGRWSVVHAGKSAPDCNDVNSLDIPMGIAPTCTDGRVLYPNPNP